MKSILVGLYFVIALICNVVALNSGTTDESYSMVGYSCLTILFSYLFVDYKVNKRFSYASLFVIILFLFHFGQLMLLTFFLDTYSHIRFLVLLDTAEALYGFRVMTASLSALCLGILWRSVNLRCEKLQRRDGVDWIKVAMRIIYCTFFVKFGLDFATLVISFTSGGIAARMFVNSFPNILLFYGKVSLLGFALLLVALKNQPQKQLKLFIGIVGYILIMMVSGIRSENVGYLAVFLFIYLQSRIKALKIKQVLLYGILGFFGLTFVVAVGQFRNYSDKGLMSFYELTTDLITKDNVVLGLFDTCGDTGYTAQATINEYLPKYGPTYGDAYYKGITAIIPNLLPFVIDVGKITAESSCPIKLQKSGVLSASYENIGGSFFAEVYMNFGIYGGILMCFIWGLFFGWAGKVASVSFSTDNIYQLVIVIPIMLASVYWVRSYFGGGVREAVWDILIGLYILKKIKK